MLLNSTIDFEIRTTYHSDLISVDEIQEMIAYLTDNHYTGNYYIQQFKNDVKTLGNLPNSYTNLKEKLENTSSIPVIFR
jgi:pyruvate formate lyase activating enzyme